MRSAPLPGNELARIAALQQYEVLDTLPEQAYDDIAFIASQICDTPIALVSLVDDDRQWFKARRGIDPRETSRDLAFCAHAILQPEALFIVEDAARDERFADNPLVTSDPKIRFYAGAPLVTGDGHALGTLCVIDRKPRRLTEDQQRSLQALSRQVIAQLELRRSVAQLQMSGTELEQSHAALQRRNLQIEHSRNELADLCGILEGQAEIIERDLQRAEIIQRCLLPHEAPHLRDFCVHTLYRPGRSVGGDLFDVVGIDDRYLALVIADAAGHGVSAAMLSVLFKNRLQTTQPDGSPFQPAEALANLNRLLLADIAVPGVFVTAAYALLDVDLHQLTVASAGHTPLLLVRADGALELIEQSGAPLGLNADASYSEVSVRLRDGDRLLMYTDGLLDAGVREPATPQRIAESLSGQPLSPDLLQHVLAELTGDREREDRDDITMLMLEATPGENHFFEPTDALPLVQEEKAEPAQITRATLGATAFLVLKGRVTWTFAQVLLDQASHLLQPGHRLIVDLQHCEYMDSTVLGTLHELASRHIEDGAELVIQGAAAKIVEVFRELSMQAVLRLVSETAIPLPGAQEVIELPQTDVRRQHQRLLRAHEVLAELSDQNADEFSGVIATLRKELPDGG